MIAYDLRCARGHVFEAWFRDSGAFDEQRRGGKVPCPMCGAKKVEKALMAPTIARGGAEVRGDEPGHAAEKEATARGLKMLIKLRDEVEKHCDHVGDKFAEEARKIHYGEVDKRNIYGQATAEQSQELRDEGVEFGEIPWIPRPEN